MVYNLVSIIARRNLSNLSVKTVIYKDVFLQARSAAVKFHPSVCYASTDESPKKSGTDANQLKAAFSKTLSGKINTQELSQLTKTVIQQAQFSRVKEAPSAAQIIGFSGLIPFAGIPLLIIINGSALPGLVFAELAYGATILSFLGGSNWIDAISKGEITLEKLGLAVAPQLCGWTALILPTPLGLLLSGAGLCASLANDVLHTNYPQWYKSLRLALTAGAVGSIALTFLLNIVL